VSGERGELRPILETLWKNSPFEGGQGDVLKKIN